MYNKDVFAAVISRIHRIIRNTSGVDSGHWDPQFKKKKPL
jgi:hypothetical protein